MSMTFSVRITWIDGRLMEFTKETKWNSDRLRAWLVKKYPDCHYIYIDGEALQHASSQADRMFEAQAIDAANCKPDPFQCTCKSYHCTCGDFDFPPLADVSDDDLTLAQLIALKTGTVSDDDYPILDQVEPQAPFFATQRAIDEANAQFQAFCDDHDSDDLDDNSEDQAAFCPACAYGLGRHNHERWEDLCPPRDTGFERSW